MLTHVYKLVNTIRSFVSQKMSENKPKTDNKQKIWQRNDEQIQACGQNEQVTERKSQVDDLETNRRDRKRARHGDFFWLWMNIWTR